MAQYNNKVLIVGPSWLGDMIMSQALFKLLYKQGKVIDVLAPKWNHAVLECMPEINKALELPFDHGEAKLIRRYKFAKTLKKYNYSECIVIPNSFKSALIPYWAGIPKRTGWLGELRHLVLNNKEKLNKSKLPLMVQRLIGLAFIGNDSLSYKDSEDKINYSNLNSIEFLFPELKPDNTVINTIVSKYNVDNSKSLLILAPGAAFGEAKKWPAEYYAKIANEKLKQGWQICLLGSPKDAKATNEVNTKTNNKCMDLAGKLQLPETVAIISKAKIVISNDSGLLHVAAGLNIPLIGIYGSTSPDFTPPLISESKKAVLKLDNMACSPCFAETCKFGHYKCLYDIKPELVNSAITKLAL